MEVLKKVGAFGAPEGDFSFQKVPKSLNPPPSEMPGGRVPLSCFGEGRLTGESLPGNTTRFRLEECLQAFRVEGLRG